MVEKIKDGVVINTTDTCDGDLSKARLETAAELLAAKDAFIQDVWTLLGYRENTLGVAESGNADAFIQAQYDELTKACTQEYNRLTALINTRQSNSEVYAIIWTRQAPDYIKLEDKDSNGIWDFLDNLKFWK